jgi:hypothetical protein
MAPIESEGLSLRLGNQHEAQVGRGRGRDGRDGCRGFGFDGGTGSGHIHWMRVTDLDGDRSQFWLCCYGGHSCSGSATNGEGLRPRFGRSGRSWNDVSSLRRLQRPERAAGE